MTPRPDSDRRWQITGGDGGWFNVCQRREGKAVLETVAIVFSEARAEVVRDALMAAYGGKVYEAPRRPVGTLVNGGG